VALTSNAKLQPDPEEGPVLKVSDRFGQERLPALEAISVAAEPAALTEAEPPSESLAGAEAAVSLTETTEYVVELLVQATEAIQPVAEAAALTTQGPGAESLTGAEAQVRSQSRATLFSS